jgi:Mlc titration factor MtfA (ptsG expression regulator)
MRRSRRWPSLRRRRAEPDAAELRIAVERLSARWGLRHDEVERLVGLVHAFVQSVRFEPARGFDVDDTIRVVVATHACRLLVGLELDEFPQLSGVIVHPSTVVLHGARPVGGGLVSSSPQALLGQATHRGPVVLSWAAVRGAIAFPSRGEDVVLHEFAHQLDMLDGTVDGTPPLDDPDARARWVAICTRVYRDVRSGRGSHVLRPYAGTNPGEFFAVATEVFFCRPHALAAGEPELYRELVAFYGQDPATRMAEPRSPASGAASA